MQYGITILTYHTELAWHNSTVSLTQHVSYYLDLPGRKTGWNRQGFSAKRWLSVQISLRKTNIQHISIAQSHYSYFISSNPSRYQPGSRNDPEKFQDKAYFIEEYTTDKKAVTFSCTYIMTIQSLIG